MMNERLCRVLTIVSGCVQMTCANAHSMSVLESSHIVYSIYFTGLTIQGGGGSGGRRIVFLLVYHQISTCICLFVGNDCQFGMLLQGQLARLEPCSQLHTPQLLLLVLVTLQAMKAGVCESLGTRLLGLYTTQHPNQSMSLCTHKFVCFLSWFS